jgi:colanic acid/amylovoran/stewartan biosynthesis glycosyltransferase WcaL/AmsK/CpsK
VNDPLARAPAAAPGVAVFSTTFLKYSQTFVYEELRHHDRYRAEVFTTRRVLGERFPFEPVHVGGWLYGALRRCSAFDRRFREGHFALVHAHFGTGAVYALPFARRHHLPLVVTFHGWDVPLLGSRQRWRPGHWRYARVGPQVLDQMTLGLCASTELRDMLAARGVPPERLAVYRLGIDLEQFKPGPRATLPTEVIMVGRFVEKKGFAYGIEAFARAAKVHLGARLTVVGDGPLETSLQRMVADLGVADRVEFTGTLPPADVARRLAASHILLAPSVVDRFGNRESGLIVAKEASATETVPIGTRHGGIPDIIEDEVTGYLVDEKDVTAMADRLSRLLGNPALWEAMSRAARAKMEREYDVRERVRALERFYDQAVAMGNERAVRK